MSLAPVPSSVRRLDGIEPGLETADRLTGVRELHLWIFALAPTPSTWETENGLPTKRRPLRIENE